MTLKEKAMKILKDAFLPKELEDLQKELKLSVTPVEVVTAKAKEYKAKDGVSVFVDGLNEGGEIVTNASKAWADAEGKTAMNDGDYIIESDNLIITVAGGVVTAVKPAQEIKPSEDPMEQMQTQMSAHKTEIEKYKTALSDQKKAFDEEIKKLRESNRVILQTLERIATTPLRSKSVIKIEKAESEMTNFEIAKFKRGEKIYKEVEQD